MKRGWKGGKVEDRGKWEGGGGGRMKVDRGLRRGNGG